MIGKFDISKQRMLQLGERVFKSLAMVLIFSMFGLMIFYGLYRPQIPDPIHGFIVPFKLFAGRVYITQFEESLENYILMATVFSGFLAIASELNQKK